MLYQLLIKLYSDHLNCSFPWYKFNLCKHSICVAEIAGILKEHLKYLTKSPRLELRQKAVWLSQQKKRMERKVAATKTHGNQSEGTSQTSTDSPFTQIHHNNNCFVFYFLDDVPNAKECRQCCIKFHKRQKITPFDTVLSHEEKWLYPDPNDASHKLQSGKHTTKFYCVRQTCMKSHFPYFCSSFLRIPAEAHSRLVKFHF